MNEQTKALLAYFRNLSERPREFRLAGNVPASMKVIELVSGALYIACEPFGHMKDEPAHDLVRRGAVLARNLEATERVGNNTNDATKHLFATYNDGIYDARRSIVHTKRWESTELVTVKKDMRALRTMLTTAYFVRAKDPRTVERYKEAFQSLKSASSYTRNKHKKRADELVTKAKAPFDSLGRPNPGRLEALLNTAIHQMAQRSEEPEQIVLAFDRREVAINYHLDQVVRLTECLDMRLKKFLAYAAENETIETEKGFATASDMVAFADTLSHVHVLPFRHVLTHAAEELREAAQRISSNELRDAAVLLDRTARGIQFQFVQQDMQELLLLASIFEKEVMAATTEQREAFVADLLALHERLPLDLDRGFKTPVVQDMRARLQTAVECVQAGNGPHWDQVYDTLCWAAKIT